MASISLISRLREAVACCCSPHRYQEIMQICNEMENEMSLEVTKEHVIKEKIINEYDFDFYSQREFDLIHKDKANNQIDNRRYFDHDGVTFIRRHSTIYGYMHGPTAIHKDIALETSTVNIYDLREVIDTIRQLDKRGQGFVLQKLMYLAPYREYIDARNVANIQGIEPPRLITHERDCWKLSFAIFDPNAKTITEQQLEADMNRKEASDTLNAQDKAKQNG